MATTDDVIKSGVIFRVLAAVNPVTWNRISFWTLASDVIFVNEQDLEGTTKTLVEKTENLDGISSDVQANSENIAASTELVNGLNNPMPITITTSMWSTNTTEYNGSSYYVYTYQADKVWTAYPIAILAPVNTSFPVPSLEETKQYNNIQHIFANTSENTITFLASKKPTINLKIVVKGVA